MIQDDFGFADLEFAWSDVSSVDPVAQSGIDDVSLRNGSATIDEVRARRGLAPLPNGAGVAARIYAGAGAQALT